MPQQKPIRIVVERRWNTEGYAVYRASLEGKPDLFEESDSRFGAVGAFVCWYGNLFDVNVSLTTEMKVEA